MLWAKRSRWYGGPQLGGVGHRVVQGGERFTTSVRIDDDVIAGIDALSGMAPLHNPINLVGIRAAMKALPDLTHVAVFDTSFHQTMPPRAYRYAVPQAWYTEHGVRRYGAHGTSVRYVSGRAAELLEPAARRPRPGRRPPRQRVQRDRGARRALGRHDDGADAAGRAGHGHKVGRHRPQRVLLPRRPDRHDGRRDHHRAQQAEWPARALGPEQRPAHDLRGRRGGQRRRRAGARGLLLPAGPRHRRAGGAPRPPRRPRLHRRHRREQRRRTVKSAGNAGVSGPRGEHHRQRRPRPRPPRPGQPHGLAGRAASSRPTRSSSSPGTRRRWT